MWRKWSIAIGSKLFRAWRAFSIPVTVHTSAWCRGFADRVRNVSIGERLGQMSDDAVAAFLKPVTDELAGETKRQQLLDRATRLPEWIANFTTNLAAEDNAERKATIAAQLDALKAELANASSIPQTVTRSAIDAIDLERLSYAFALAWAAQFPPKWKLQPAGACDGFVLQSKNESLPFGSEEYDAIMYYISNGITFEKKLAQQKSIAAAFLKENAGAEGVVALPSGLQYKRLSPPAAAASPQPTKSSRVIYHARGGRHRGRSSFSTGGMDEDDAATFGSTQPLVDRVADLIDGLQEGFPLMRMGETFKFWIEAKLAFNDLFGLSGSLFPHDVLVLEVKLIDVEELSDAELGAGAPPADADQCSGGGECQRAAFQLRSDAFANGTALPGRFTCEAGRGGGYSPPLAWTGVPDGTESFVLLVASDAEDGQKLVVHWLLYDIPANVTQLKAGESTPTGAKAGSTSMAARSFFLPPCPGQDQTTADVVSFRIFALSTPSVGEARDLSWNDIADAVQANIVGAAALRAVARKGEGLADVHRRALHKVTDVASDAFN
jgi:hypothetical protein